MPPEVAAIAECGFAIWAKDDVDDKLPVTIIEKEQRTIAAF